MQEDTRQGQQLKKTSITENASDFYRLHYPQKKSASRQNQFRAKSVISVTEKHNPEQVFKQRSGKRKGSQIEKIINGELLPKSKVDEYKPEPFSIKKVLSGSKEGEGVQEYFSKYPPRSFGSLEDISKQSVGMRNALLRCRDEKLKVAKVLSSQRQTETTKMDYLQLKKEELDQEKKIQMKHIYDQFFKKQYQQLHGHGDKAYQSFTDRMEQVIQTLHSQLFSQ